MASSYTTNIGIEKIESGAQSGTWGTTTNTNLDLIDQALGGQVAITLPATGSTGTPNDIAITNATLSDGRNIYMEFVDGGDLGGTAYARITPNDAEKIMYVRNSLTASRSLILFQGTYDAAKDVVLAAGDDAVVKFNGVGTGSTTSLVLAKLSMTSLTASGTITAGTYVGIPTADLTTVGMVELATIAETNTGTDATRGVTPDGLDGWTGSAQLTTLGTVATGTWNGTVIAEAYLPNASLTAEGVVELATQAEVDAGTDANRVVTASTLTNFSGLGGGGSPAASTTVSGILKLATIAETNTGTDALKAVTPDALDGWTGSVQVTTVGTIGTGTWQGTAINQTYLTGQSGTNTGDEVAATETVSGIVELATQVEVDAGTDPDRVVTAATLTNFSGLGAGGAPASTTVAGIVELATIAETNTGTDTTRALTADGLDGWTGSAQVTTLGTVVTGVWNGSAIGAGYLPTASTTVSGLVELATIAETNTGTDASTAVTPDALDGWTGSAQVTTVGTIGTGTWQGTAINQTYLTGQSGTNTGNETLSSINALSITTVGTITTGTWNGTVIAEAYLPNASLTAEGVVELATQAEVDAGSDTDRVVTPATLAAYSGLGGSSLTAVKATTYTAVSGETIPCNATTPWTLTLPASPAVGDHVSFFDYAETFGTNNLTITSTSEIMNSTSDLICDVKNFSGTLTYVNATRGWILT